jgi:hypothetical protein
MHPIETSVNSTIVTPSDSPSMKGWRKSHLCSFQSEFAHPARILEGQALRTRHGLRSIYSPRPKESTNARRQHFSNDGRTYCRLPHRCVSRTSSWRHLGQILTGVQRRRELQVSAVWIVPFLPYIRFPQCAYHVWWYECYRHAEPVQTIIFWQVPTAFTHTFESGQDQEDYRRLETQELGHYRRGG